jgi:hypothetical protein
MSSGDSVRRSMTSMLTLPSEPAAASAEARQVFTIGP